MRSVKTENLLWIYKDGKLLYLLRLVLVQILTKTNQAKLLEPQKNKSNIVFSPFLSFVDCPTVDVLF